MKSLSKKENIKGTGLIIKTIDKKFLFQERDKNTERNPGAIAPFGGGIENGETPHDCVVREIKEELELDIENGDLVDLGLFESHFAKGTFIQMYYVSGVNADNLLLHEGKSIVSVSLKEALNHEMITDFTKEVLRKSGVIINQ